MRKCARAHMQKGERERGREGKEREYTKLVNLHIQITCTTGIHELQVHVQNVHEHVAQTWSTR